jgi:hypothetical protein
MRAQTLVSPACVTRSLIEWPAFCDRPFGKIGDRLLHAADGADVKIPILGQMLALNFIMDAPPTCPAQAEISNQVRPLRGRAKQYRMAPVLQKRLSRDDRGCRYMWKPKRLRNEYPPRSRGGSFVSIPTRFQGIARIAFLGVSEVFACRVAICFGIIDCWQVSTRSVFGRALPAGHLVCRPGLTSSGMFGRAVVRRARLPSILGMFPYCGSCPKFLRVRASRHRGCGVLTI